MLTLKNVVKVYGEGETEVHALKGVSLNFRESEFVAILGPSGCGKTTMLNIVGGLDRYTEGDLVINGKSTKDFTDGDWDNYRNHSVGFIFQSYNLIPHQSVIKNVELALTLSGVGREERYARALKALEEVGLKNQAKKMPNQLSGGQMQRVAIARAIVNDPDIILADEPTGALDSETSVQVMEILKELSKTRLVVMVTHNAELARDYATRTINLFDGIVVDDTLPCSEDEAKNSAFLHEKKFTSNKDKKASMSLLTAFSLSLNNLFTKKGRTVLTSLAGSIGIIGIALILSLSSGFNAYVQNIQRDTLSNYPVTISQENINTTGALSVLGGITSNDDRNKNDQFPSGSTLGSHNIIGDMVKQFGGLYENNDLTGFSKYLQDYVENNDTSDIISAINYTYNYSMSIYSANRTAEGVHKRLYPLSVPEMSSVKPSDQNLGSYEAILERYYNMFVTLLRNQTIFSEMIDNQKLVREQYELLQGSYATGENEAVLVVDSYNQISDLSLYTLGLMNDDDIRWIFRKMIGAAIHEKEKTDEEMKALGYTRSDVYFNGIEFSDIIGLTYKIATTPDGYTTLKDAEGNEVLANFTDPQGNEVTRKYWTNENSSETINAYLDGDDALSFKIVGVVRLKKGVSAGCLTGTVCYTPSLTKAVKSRILNANVTKDYLNKVEVNDGEYFKCVYQPSSSDIGGDKFPTATNILNIKAELYSTLGDAIGYFNENKPTFIEIYPTSFEAKDDVIKIIDDYNAKIRAEEGDESKNIVKYTDYLGLMMESITTIINAVTYVLIAFVSISLIVSSIMIGIITYISVLERTKEIGVLRSVGASKRDISRVFNAETFIVGATSGIMGILITLLLNIPINIIITALSGLTNVAVLPVAGAFILIAISIVLTVVAGLIPSGFAAKRDPVVALRSE